MDMVQLFNSELSSLYEIKPPISKAKMSQVTKAAIKGIKMYKHVVQSVERFIGKCKPEYKLPGLYVIDSIVRQSRHQYGADRDVFGPRFQRNFKQTFHSLFSSCHADDKPKIVRVLNLWQHNNVFPAEIIQPLLDMANPNAPLRVSDSPPIGSAGDSEAFVKHLQQLAHTMGINRGNRENSNSTNGPEVTRFNKKLLEYNYDDDEDDDEDRGDTPTEAEPPISETVLQLKQTIQQEESNDLAKTISKNLMMHPDLLKRLSEIPRLQDQANVQSNSSAGSQLDQTISNVLHNNNLSQLIESIQSGQNAPTSKSHEFDQYSVSETNSLSSPDRQHRPQQSYENNSSDQHYSHRSYREERNDWRERRVDRRERSRSRSPRRSRSSRRSRSRSPRRRDRDRDRDRYDRPERNEERIFSPAALEREHERDRRKRGLPEMKPNHFTICSTTLFLGHLPKLVSEEDITDLLKVYGEILSIELIPPRGCAFVCMKNRSDAYRILQESSKSFRIHGNYLKLAWAPGKGMKGREYKELWHVDQGASYIPHSLLRETTDLDLLAEGGMIDEESLPAHIREVRTLLKQKQEQEKAIELLKQQEQQQQGTSSDSTPIQDSNNTVSGVMPSAAAIPAVHVNFSVPPPNLAIPPPPVVIPDVVSMHHQPPPPPPPPPPQSNQFPPNPLLVMNNQSAGVPLLPSSPNLPPPLYPQPPPQLNVPPPQILASRPPPPLPWNHRGPTPASLVKGASLSGSNTQPLGTPMRGIRPGLSVPLLPPRSSDELVLPAQLANQFNPKVLPPRIPTGDKMTEKSVGDDPFAPSVYELKAMERSPFPRGLLSPVRPLAPPRFDDQHSMNRSTGPPGPFQLTGRWEMNRGRDRDRRNERMRGNSAHDSGNSRSERPTGIRVPNRTYAGNNSNGSDRNQYYDKELGGEKERTPSDQRIQVKKDEPDST